MTKKVVQSHRKKNKKQKKEVVQKGHLKMIYITEEHEERDIYIYIYCADTHFATLFFFFFF